MKESRFSEQQIAFILKQAEDGRTVDEVCRKAGISIQTDVTPGFHRAGTRDRRLLWCTRAPEATAWEATLVEGMVYGMEARG